MRRIGRNPLALWFSFILAHLWLGLVNLYGPGLPLGDVTIVYKFWIDQIIHGNFWVGIDSAWVYPILAIFPMLAAEAFGPTLYSSTWLSLILVLNSAAFFVLTGPKRESRNTVAAWWWIIFLLLLGPIALGRIDSVAVPLAMLGMLFISTRPLIASGFLTIAMWVKVWPAAILLAMVVSLKARRGIVLVAVGISGIIVAGALVFGSGANVFSFFSQQTGRGLQVESPVSTIWLWQAFSGVPGTSVYYDQHILTWQVTGNGTGLASALMTPIMALAVLAVVLAGVLAIKRGVETGPLVATLALALVAALIGFNKVGSPQFITWFAVPIVLGLITARGSDRWWFTAPASIALAAAGLTQLIYPYWYGWLLALHPLFLIALTARNLLVFAIFGWAVVTLLRLDRPESESEQIAAELASKPALWPLGSRT